MKYNFEEGDNMLENLSTEHRNEKTMNLDEMSIKEVLQSMKEDRTVALAVENEIEEIEKVVPTRVRRPGWSRTRGDRAGRVARCVAWLPSSAVSRGWAAGTAVKAGTHGPSQYGMAWTPRRWARDPTRAGGERGELTTQPGWLVADGGMTRPRDRRECRSPLECWLPGRACRAGTVGQSGGFADKEVLPHKAWGE